MATLVPEIFQNNATSPLNGGIDASQTTITVVSGAVFPSVGRFRIKIEDEIMICTARSTNDLTVVRAQEGTTGATHADTRDVTHILTAGSYYQTVSDNVHEGVIADRQAAAKAGRIWIPTDGQRLSRDTGSAWQSYGPFYKLPETPLVSAFTWVNQGSATAVDQGGGIALTTPQNNGASLRILKKSAAATPYHVIISIRAAGILSAANYSFGLLHRESSTGKLLIAAMRFAATSAFPQLLVQKYTNETTTGSSLLIAGNSHWQRDLVWFRIGDNGTNLTYDISIDGVNWLQLATEARGTHFSGSGFPNEVGFFIENNLTTASTMYANLFSWEETS